MPAPMTHQNERERLAGMLPGFYWLIDGAIAGCSRPGVTETPGRRSWQDDGPGQAQADAGDALEQDLMWLRRQGIRAVLTLTETPLAEEAVARHELAALHLPVPDLHAPAPDQFTRALGFIDLQRALGRAVVVHCLVGQGRTGTILAAYRIRGGASPEEALRELRVLCPGAVGSSEQEQALHAFARRRDWIV